MSTKESRASKIREVAKRLGTRPEWLDALINFETAGTYNPKIKNPSSSARGLIQVIDSTARSDFDVPDSLTLVNMYPGFNSQMDNVVFPYLAKYMPFSTKQSLYMAVFYPAYRNKPLLTPFPARVRKANPGINTPADYIRFVEKRIRKDTLSVPKLPLILILSALGVSLYYMRTRGVI